MPVKKKLHELGNGIFAYTQLPGTWGWSNSGLVTDGDESLLIDTLFDEKITGEMLEAMRRATSAANRIGCVVNTHGNGDHCYGNALVKDAEIVSTVACKEELKATPPKKLQTLLRAAAMMERLGAGGRAVARAFQGVGIDKLRVLAEAGRLAVPAFGVFDFSGESVLPNRTFEGALTLKVGDKTVELMEVGPAHTAGDAVAYIPSDKTLFTGDILFKDAHPVVWQGPVSNWIRALQRLLDLEVETVVPGHGPLTDKSGFREALRYLEVLTEETRKRFDAGLTCEEAVLDLALDEFKGWLDAERIYVNVHTLYRDFGGNPGPSDVLTMFAGMARTQARLSA